MTVINNLVEIIIVEGLSAFVNNFLLSDTNYFTKCIIYNVLQ